MEDITFTTIIKRVCDTCSTMLFTHKQNLCECEIHRKVTERQQKHTKQRSDYAFYSSFTLASFYSPRFKRIIVVFNLAIHNICMAHMHTCSVNNLTRTIANWILNVFTAALKLIRWMCFLLFPSGLTISQANNHYTIEAHHIVISRHKRFHNRNLWARVALACSCSCSCIYACIIEKTHFSHRYLNYVCVCLFICLFTVCYRARACQPSCKQLRSHTT